MELMPKEDVFADITLKSDVIKVYVNGEILQERSRRIFEGYYKRYDGMAFYVIDVVKDLETGGDVVICRRDSFNNQEYFTLTREAFCSKVEYGGKTIKKYYRTNKRSPISEKEMQEIAADNYPIKIRRTLKEDELHYTRQSDNYDDYARDILKWYRRDVEAYKLTKQQGALVGIEQYEDYLHIQEDIQFLHLCLKTTLTKYAKFFKEHYVKGKSLRKYAEENNLNRGSVEYLQKRLIVEFSSNLLDRDVSEGKCRLKVD